MEEVTSDVGAMEVLATIFAVIIAPLLANLLNRLHVTVNLHSSYNALVALALSLVWWWLVDNAPMEGLVEALKDGLAIAGLSSVLLASYKGKFSGRADTS